MDNINYVDIGKDNEEIKEELLEAIGKVLVSGKFILGEETKRFEDNIAGLIGTKYAVGVNSGTDALFLSIKALGIGIGSGFLFETTLLTNRSRSRRKGLQ